MNLTWKINWHQVAIALLIGFGAGAVFGPWYVRENRQHRKRAGMKHFMVERFSSELRLTAEQKQQVAAIFDAKAPRMAAIQQEVKPKFQALRNETQAEVRKLLNPEQQKKLDALNAKMEERWKEKEKFLSS